ncbi:MAG: TonB-dependent receptor, partial [Candidatus Cloacimonetes bacterium]|nr:TonB-dependent receptor [Candidatus Cloacimonadota bacterium]
GGPIGLLNVDLIRDVNFYSGGFPVSYGDRLSAVMELKLRDGNREEFDGQLDLNFAGFGGIIEGPLKDRGSWLLSFRRSYLDLLIKSIDLGTSIAPTYGDFQTKLNWDIDQENRISLLALGGDDHSHSDNETGLENDMIYYGDQDLYENTVGLSWQRLWPGLGYSNTSFSSTFSSFREKFYKTGSMSHLFTNRSLEQDYKIRNINVLRLHERYSLEFGTEIKFQHFLYDNLFTEQYNIFGDTIPELQQKDKIAAVKSGVFMQNRIALSSKLKLNLGIRMDYYTYNENFQVSPRGNLNYALTGKTSFNISWGIYYQNLPLIILSQHKQNLELPDPRAIHYIAGISHLLTENTRLTLEIYQKEYKYFPVDPDQPGLFLIDEIFYNYGFFTGHGPLHDSGIALSRGVEVMAQKKLARDFYGLISASWFRSKYQNEGEKWRNRSFDNRYTIGIEGGYKPDYQWEFSLRWLYAGGAPYTPFDVLASTAQNQGIFDEELLNECRYPDYHSLNIRCDRRFHFQRSNLVIYLSIWNAYNRKNIASYFWNENENKQDTIYQWTLLPIFGVEYEF